MFIILTDNPETFSGTAGDDSIFGLGGGDRLSGLGGNDIVNGGEGSDFVQGNDGNDTLEGVGGNDELLGGNGNDSIVGEGGNDSISGGNGNDNLDGGTGRDTVNGDAGNDAILGGNDNDTLNGGEGADTLDGGDDADRIIGGGGSDSLIGGLGADTVFGNDGDDSIEGGNGNDTLTGTAGNDSIFGGAGGDVIAGDEGNDTLEGGQNSDSLEGGPGADRFEFVLNQDNIVDRILDASPGDSIRVGGADFSGTVDEGSGGAGLGANQVRLDTTPGSNTLFVGIDGAPGADLVIALEGQFAAVNFALDGQDILIVPLPSASIGDVAVTEGDAGETELVFTVSLPAAASVDFSVTATTSNGTATAGPDYSATQEVVTISAGQTSATFSVPVFGDTADEDNETFTVTLSNPIAGTIGDGTAIGTILDDDATPPPPPTVSIAGASIGEGDAGSVDLVFAVTLSAATTQEVVVTAASANGTATAGSDYTAISAQVTIPAGQASGSVAVPILGDTVEESDETFTVALSNPVNAALGAQVVAAGGILDDDGAAVPPVLSIVDASLVEGDSGAANLVFTIGLSAAAAQTVTADAVTGDGTATAGSDYLAANTVIAITPGQLSTTFSVPILGDNLAEANETFALTLSNVAGGAVFPGNAATTGATGTILDDDSAVVAIGAASVVEGNSGTTNLVFPLTLTAALGSDVVVSFRTVDGMARPGQDYTDIAAGSVTIPAGQTSGQIVVAVSGDTALECDETLAVELTSVTGGANIDLTASFAFGTIVDDDAGTPPLVTGASPSGTEAGEGLAGGAGNDSLSGLGGNDTLSGVAGADILAGGSDNDLLFGDLPGDGNDSLLGGDGADTGVGGEGADTLSGGAGDDFLIGEGGADTLIGGPSNDVLFGLDGADYQCGEEGNDFLFGGGGDLMDGGADNDRVHVNATDLFATGSDGFFDVLVLLDNAPIPGSGNQGATAIDLGATLNQNLSAGGPRLQGFEAVDASLASAGVSVTGAAGTVDFGQGPQVVGSVLFGSTFADTIAGSTAADILLGNLGADVLVGGAGNDTLIADAGNDTLTGGADADSFFYLGGAVRITDFAPGVDAMLLSAALGIPTPAAARLLLIDVGADAVLPIAPGMTVTFAGISSSALTALDFQII